MRTPTYVYYYPSIIRVCVRECSNQNNNCVIRNVDLECELASACVVFNNDICGRNRSVNEQEGK